MTVRVTDWRTTPSGDDVARVELVSDQVLLGVRTRGATVNSLVAPDAAGTWTDVVPGFDTLEPYVDIQPFIGATVGRK